MQGKGESNEPTTANFVPTWNGKPETFSHFVTEIRWALNSTKKDERALLASRIVRRALQSDHPTLVALLYKLDPEEFNSEDGVDKLVKFLEASPMNRQPLPDAGNKIGGYYRRLHKKPNEAIPAFLVREDRVHDEMLKALQRLLRERELTFDDYEVDLGELKAFCGIPEGTSLYFGPPEGLDAEEDGPDQGGEEEASSRTATPEGFQGRPFTRSTFGRRSSSRESRASSSKRSSKEDKPGDHKKPKGKDLLQRLMEKGLMPLAALDVIRGWMILEMSTSTEDERRIIKAATRNKLGYHEIKQALLSMYEDRGSRGSRPFDFGHGRRHAYWTEEVDPEGWHDEDGSVYYQDVEGAWWSEDQWALYGGQDGEWVQEEAEDEADGEPDSALVQLQEDQREIEKERQEIEAMMAENDRNLQDARRAVAAAVKDRGWGGGVAQRPYKPTSTYMNKGHGKHGGLPKGGQQKGKVNFSEEAHFAKGAGKGKGKWSSPSWGKGGKGTKGGKSRMKGGTNFHLLTIDETDYCMAATEGASALGPSESLVDTGATASAGGQEAVEKLCAAIAAARPDVKFEVSESVAAILSLRLGCLGSSFIPGEHFGR